MRLKSVQFFRFHHRAPIRLARPLMARALPVEKQRTRVCKPDVKLRIISYTIFINNRIFNPAVYVQLNCNLILTFKSNVLGWKSRVNYGAFAKRERALLKATKNSSQDNLFPADIRSENSQA
jgi:hypothetical protein